MNRRKIVFDLSKIDKNRLKSVGVYKILNKINGHFYIGSSDRSFSERFKEHCRCYELFKKRKTQKYSSYSLESIR